MADDKKNIPDAGKVDNPPEPGKVEPAKAAPPVQDQPAPAKADASVVEGAPKVATPPAAEQPAPADKEAPKDKDAPAPSMEGTPQPGKDEKQTTIHGMGDPAPAGKVVDFTAARDGAAKGKPPEKAAAPDKGKRRRRASPRKRLRPRIRASRRIKRRMRPSPAGAAHPRLTRRPPTRPSRNLGTKCPKANRLRGKALPSKQRPRLQPSSRPPLGMPPVA